MKIDFEFESNYGVFRDALHLPDDHGLSEQQIVAMQKQRFDNWIIAIETPPDETIIDEIPIDDPIQEIQSPIQE